MPISPSGENSPTPPVVEDRHDKGNSDKYAKSTMQFRTPLLERRIFPHYIPAAWISRPTATQGDGGRGRRSGHFDSGSGDMMLTPNRSKHDLNKLFPVSLEFNSLANVGSPRTKTGTASASRDQQSKSTAVIRINLRSTAPCSRRGMGEGRGGSPWQREIIYRVKGKGE